MGKGFKDKVLIELVEMRDGFGDDFFSFWGVVKKLIFKS